MCVPALKIAVTSFRSAAVAASIAASFIAAVHVTQPPRSLARPSINSRLVVTALGASEARAQIDLSGSWAPRYHEDFDERIPGPEIANFLGLPINDAARQWALSWDASRLTLPEHQCRVHNAAYIYRGPLLVRI